MEKLKRQLIAHGHALVEHEGNRIALAAHQRIGRQYRNFTLWVGGEKMLAGIPTPTLAARVVRDMLQSWEQPTAPLMRPDLKARWVRALRSGKYPPCWGHLHDQNGGFCVMGVLADLYCQDTGAKWVPNYYYYYDLVSHTGSVARYTLPLEVFQWAGIRNIYAIRSIDRIYDNGSMSHADIASIIEAMS